MHSPADMEFIQIDITNACNMRCSNCTRFCGNHENVFFMEFDTFRRAVDSLDGFDGVVGLIGGEPTLHPEFERFAEYMKERFGRPASSDALLYPQRDFICAIHQREFDSEKVRELPNGKRFMKKYGAGLWSNMSGTYYKHYEVIQDTFSVEYLNDHMNPSYHQPGLFARKDMDIPDAEWEKLRDNCWVQNTWSATITPKGAFFCEIAGALDMLFDGAGGWKIESGWWKREPKDFKDQLHWCELCGFALEGLTFTRDSREEMDDVSTTLYEMLKAKGSPKLRSGRIHPVRILDGVIMEDSKPEDKRFLVGDRYIEKYGDRFQEQNSVLFQIDHQEIVIQDGEAFGKRLAKALESDQEQDRISKDMTWILLKQRDGVQAQEFKKMIGKRIFNPGSLHLGDGYLFFCRGALSLRKIGLDRIAHMQSSDELQSAWQKEKVIRLSDVDAKTDLRRRSIAEGKRYAIWGAGMLGELFAEMVGLSGGKISMVVDRSQDKIGKSFAGVKICRPEDLRQKAGDLDLLLIAHHLCFEDIEKEAIGMGIPKEKIILPFEV